MGACAAAATGPAPSSPRRVTARVATTGVSTSCRRSTASRPKRQRQYEHNRRSALAPRWQALARWFRGAGVRPASRGGAAAQSVWTVPGEQGGTQAEARPPRPPQELSTCCPTGPDGVSAGGCGAPARHCDTRYGGRGPDKEAMKKYDMNERERRNRLVRRPRSETARERRDGEPRRAADDGGPSSPDSAESHGEGGHALKRRRPGIGREEQIRPHPPTEDLPGEPP